MASAEPAASEVRNQMRLPPKSFADALAADKPAVQSGGTSESSDTKVNGESNSGDDYGDANGEKTVKHKASALRIVNTHPEEAEKDDKRDRDENKPLVEKKAETKGSKNSKKTAENKREVKGEKIEGAKEKKEKLEEKKKTEKKEKAEEKKEKTEKKGELKKEPMEEVKGKKKEKVEEKKEKVEEKKEKNKTEKKEKAEEKEKTEKKEKPKEPMEEVKAEEKVEMERPVFDRQESKHKYSATGLDDRSKHQEQKSSSVRGSNSNDAGPKPGPTNEEKTERFEKYEDSQNGSKLVSVKTTPEFEKALKWDAIESRYQIQDRKLASGRQAGKSWERSAIRWAPLNVPLQRRLQTLVVLFHTLCIPLFVSSFFFLCAIPLFWSLLIPYMIYCIFSQASTSGTLSHRSNFLRSLPIWSLFASYFPARLHRSEELSPNRKYIFGYHPHGIISHGAFAAFGTEALGFSQLFPGITNTLLTLDSNFRVPLYRDYALAMGLASVSKESCENLLSKGGVNGEGMGRAITIVIGGARESLDAQPHSLRLVLKRRKGFVKMAIKTGADLVPVLAFGENDLYDQVTSVSHPTIHKMQLLVKKILGFTIPLFHARGVFNYDVGLMPYRRPLNIVVGRPVKVLQADHPEQEDIDRAHEEYVAELERLWDLWKDGFAKERVGELEILE